MGGEAGSEHEAKDYRYGLTGHDTFGWDARYYSPDGAPWCRFARGSIWCVNSAGCLNPKHREKPAHEGSHTV